MEAITAIRQLCEKLSEQVGDKFDLEIKLSNRMSTTYGCVRFQMNKKTKDCVLTEMVFSSKFLENASREQIIDTVKHEWCHYIILKTTHHDHGHDELWKRWARSVGCSDKATTEGVLPQSAYKYVVWCEDCGMWEGRTRKSKLTDSPELYRCAKCGGRLHVTQNR